VADSPSWLGPLANITGTDLVQLAAAALGSIPRYHGASGGPTYPYAPMAEAVGKVAGGLQQRSQAKQLGQQIQEAVPGKMGELLGKATAQGQSLPAGLPQAIESQTWEATKQKMLGTLPSDYPNLDTLKQFAGDPSVDPRILQNRIDWSQAQAAKDAAKQQQLDMMGQRLKAMEQLQSWKQSQAAAGGGGTIDDDTAQGLAQAYTAGDRSVIQGLGYGKLGASNRAKVLNYAYGGEGLSGGEMAARGAEFKGTRSAFQTVRTWVSKAEISQQGFLKNLNVALGYMQKVDPGQIPIVNQMVAQGKAVTGDPNIVAYAQALTTASREYERLVTGPNSNAQLLAGAQEQAAKLLTTAQTPDQVKAVANVMQTDITNSIQSARAELATLSQDLRGTTPLSGSISAAPAPAGAQTAAQPQAQANAQAQAPARIQALASKLSTMPSEQRRKVLDRMSPDELQQLKSALGGP
jgi:hypothetical protein